MVKPEEQKQADIVWLQVTVLVSQDNGPESTRKSL